MRFVEEDHAVEIRPQPFEQLLEARLLTRVGAQRGIGGKQDALIEPDLRSCRIGRAAGSAGRLPQARQSRGRPRSALSR
jgi:hypothetical protein